MSEQEQVEAVLASIESFPYVTEIRHEPDSTRVGRKATCLPSRKRSPFKTPKAVWRQASRSAGCCPLPTRSGTAGQQVSDRGRTLAPL